MESKSEMTNSDKYTYTVQNLRTFSSCSKNIMEIFFVNQDFDNFSLQLEVILNHLELFLNKKVYLQHRNFRKYKNVN